MKRNIQNIKIKMEKVIIILFAFLLVMPSCQDRLDEMNMNPNALTELPVEYLFTRAVRETFRTNIGRIQQDFGGQYSHLAVSEGWDRKTDTYDIGHLRGDVSQQAFRDIYRNTIRFCVDIQTYTKPDGTQASEVKHALTDIVAIFNFAKLTDLFGDVPYSQAGMGKEGVFLPEYDAQKDIYADMVERLKNDIAVLKNADFADAFPGADPIYDNNKDKWIRLANSFRLRLAMRARFVSETKSQYEAVIAECLNEPLIESNDQNATLQHWESEDGSLYNPWYSKYIDKYESGIYEFNVSEKYVNQLMSTNDPRLPVMVSKATVSGAFIKWLEDSNDPRLANVQDTENMYVGMRNGLITEERDGSVKVNFEGRNVTVLKWPRKDLSTLSNFVIAKDQPLYFMTASEVWFLRAEAALFGLGSGDANEMYQNGISMAMGQWGIGQAEIDQYLASSSEGALVGTEEEKFEQIGTQMWLGFVPNYIEAWFNIRRTGYPVIPRRTSPELAKGVTDGILPSRVRYPLTTERDLNGTNMQVAIDRMGGDELNTRVWWDVRD